MFNSGHQFEHSKDNGSQNMSILLKQYLKIYVHIAVAMKIVTNTIY